MYQDGRSRYRAALFRQGEQLCDPASPGGRKLGPSTYSRAGIGSDVVHAQNPQAAARRAPAEGIAGPQTDERRPDRRRHRDAVAARALARSHELGGAAHVTLEVRERHNGSELHEV